MGTPLEAVAAAGTPRPRGQFLRTIRSCLVASLTALLAWAESVPQQDRRFTAAEGTGHPYAAPVKRTRAEWESHRDHLRKQILAAAGLLPMPGRPRLNTSVFGRISRAGYSVEKVYIETLPGYYLGGNLYRPSTKTGKVPGVLSPHGHWKRGRLENTELGSIPGRAINLARQGYIVFSYDMVGYNDTMQTPHVFGAEREQLYNFGPLGLQLWNSIRALDFLESLPDVDPARLAATGASGGGTQTFLLAAVDDRLKVTAPVNMISAHMQGGSPCENAPGLRHDTFNVEIGALSAPRPMLMVSATGDWTRDTPRLEFPAIRQIYELYGAAGKVETVQIDAPHNYNQPSREAVYTFFAKHLLQKPTPVKEEPFAIEADADLLVWHGRSLPPGAANYEGVFAAWKQVTRVPHPDREALRYALSVEVPQTVQETRNGDWIYLGRPGRGDRVPAIWMPGKGTPRLVLHPDGAEAARTAQPPKGPTLYLDAFQTGTARAPRLTTAPHFFTFHRSDAQNRVQDVLTALVWLGHPKRRVEIKADAGAAAWAIFAAAVAGGTVRVDADVADYTDDDYLRDFFVPGIQRVGGLSAAKALVHSTATK